MKASEQAVTFLREQVIYIIPYFQRGYVWNEENWEGIWQELTADRPDCFLGSIILKREEYHRPETCKTIIDGQQRLTTLTILIRALHDFFAKKPDTSAEALSQFRELIFYKSTRWLPSGVNTQEVCRIEHSRLNKKDYTDVIEGRISSDEIDAESEASSILKCYKFFCDKLEISSSEDVSRVCMKLMVDTSKILVVIDLTEKENEQVIFDTINSTGVKLTASDIIKNAIFQKIRKSGENVEEFYRESWEKTFEPDAEIQSLWLETKGVGQNQRSNIDLFFYSFAIIKRFFNAPKDKMSDLATKYKNHISEMTTAQAKDFVKEICSYAKTYMDTFIGFDDVTCFSFTDDKQRLLQILDTVKITAFDAFILYALRNYTEAEQIEVFKKLECYVMRHYIIGNSSKMGSFLQDAVEMIKGSFEFDEKLSDDLISDIRLERALKYINNTKAKLVLFWIELHRHTKKESDLYGTPLNYAYELEHIMPQRWAAYWGIDALPVLDDDGNAIPVEEAARIRNEAVYEIGNMTLLSSKLNKELQNYSFSNKVNGTIIGKKERPGMRDFSALTITKEVVNLEPLIWDERKIAERTTKLTSEFKQIWPVKKANNRL